MSTKQVPLLTKSMLCNGTRYQIRTRYLIGDDGKEGELSYEE